MKWYEGFRINPLDPLLSAKNPALSYFVSLDLLADAIPPIESLWELPEPARLLKKQNNNGSWTYPGKTSDVELGTNHDLLQTFRNLRYLVEKYGFTIQHSSICKAAEHILSLQNKEGDIRGILGNQYMPYYMGAILELLIKAGLHKDARVEKAMHWLLDMRQEDGGWIIPLQMYKITYLYEVSRDAPILPDRSKPFAHLTTGMVLRAFAAHPAFCQKVEVRKAGELLKSRFFQQDAYTGHKSKEYWYKFSYPFWWTDLLSAMDTLSKLGFTKEDKYISRGLNWFIDNQNEQGLWKAYYESKVDPEANLWVTLAVCRVFKRFFDG